MRALRLAFATTAALAATQAIAGTSAEARCTRLAFSVNDYGKDGPTRDAKNLLDKYIAKWTAENGIKSYRTGKKDVTCELFLDFGFFDEWTCKAAATVCWDGAGPAQTAMPTEGKATGSQKAARKKAAESKPGEGQPAAAPKSAQPVGSSPVSTGAIPAPPPTAPAAAPKQ